MKTILKTFFLIVTCLGTSNALFAQDFSQQFDTAKIVSKPAVKTGPVQKQSIIVKPKAPKPIRSEFSGGFRLNTDGWSIFIEGGKAKAIDEKHGERFFNLHFWQVEFSEKNNPKETSSTSGAPTATGSTGSYVFGKINNFYMLKLGYGVRTMIAGKPDIQGSVSVHWVNAGGFSLGLLKPYYINVSDYPAPIKYSPNTQMDFLNYNNIVGNAGFSNGLGEIQIISGIHYKTALHFDFSGNFKNVIAIEAGLNAEYYFQEVQLMANNPSTAFFADAYLSFQYGRRW